MKIVQVISLIFLFVSSEYAFATKFPNLVTNTKNYNFLNFSINHQEIAKFGEKFSKIFGMAPGSDENKPQIWSRRLILWNIEASHTNLFSNTLMLLKFIGEGSACKNVAINALRNLRQMKDLAPYINTLNVSSDRRIVFYWRRGIRFNFKDKQGFQIFEEVCLSIQTELDDIIKILEQW